MGAQFSREVPKIAFLNILNPVKESLRLLTNCEIKSVRFDEVSLIYKHFIQLTSFRTFNVDITGLKQILRNTFLEGLELKIWNHFRQNRASRINFLDLLAALITYSNIYWKRKVQIIFNVFDFDRNKVISVDEAVAMVVSWIRGICKMIGMIIPMRKDLEALSSEVFKAADIVPDDQLTLNEQNIGRMLQFVYRTDDLYQLLQINQEPERFFIHRKTLSQVRPSNTRHRRLNNSLSSDQLSKSFVQQNSQSFESRKRINNLREDNRLFIVVQNFIINRSLIHSMLDIYLKLDIRKVQRVKTEGNFYLELWQNYTNNPKISKQLGKKLKRFKSFQQQYITFWEVLRLMFPNANKSQIRRLKEWVQISGNESSNIGITYKKLDTYKQIFSKLDTNSDGFVDIYEINASFREQVLPQYLQNYFKQHNVDASKGLNFQQFVKLISNK